MDVPELKKKKINKITACLEATGSYGDHIADFLYANNYEVAVVNPFCIKAFANSELTIHKQIQWMQKLSPNMQVKTS